MLILAPSSGLPPSIGLAVVDGGILSHKNQDVSTISSWQVAGCCVAFVLITHPTQDLQIVWVVSQVREVLARLNVIHVDVCPPLDLFLALHAGAAVLSNGLGFQHKPLLADHEVVIDESGYLVGRHLLNAVNELALCTANLKTSKQRFHKSPLVNVGAKHSHTVVLPRFRHAWMLSPSEPCHRVALPRLAELMTDNRHLLSLPPGSRLSPPPPLWLARVTGLFNRPPPTYRIACELA